MSRLLLTVAVAASLVGGHAQAEPVRVVADIAPVHSLVARVMQGVGVPDLIVQQGASPHEYALRPSEAAALQDADLVFWIGAGLTPWLDSAITTLAARASVTELLEAEGTIELPFREGALFETHAPDHEGAGHEEHSDHEGHEDHDDHEGHDHGAHDPHAWLSPKNAATWLNVIAGQLSTADPENAAAYFANAAEGRVEMEALAQEIEASLAPLRGRKFVVFHDAYQYFENDFSFPSSGAISLSDASDPSPARISQIRTMIAKGDIDCVLAEPQFNPGLVAAVQSGTDAKTGFLDPLGVSLEAGPDLYPQLMRNMFAVLADCL